MLLRCYCGSRQRVHAIYIFKQDRDILSRTENMKVHRLIFSLILCHAISRNIILLERRYHQDRFKRTLLKHPNIDNAPKWCHHGRKDFISDTIIYEKKRKWIITF